MRQVYALRSIGPVVLAVLAAASLVVLYCKAHSNLAQISPVSGSASNPHIPGAWMALSKLVIRSTHMSPLDHQHQTYRRFEEYMQHAHYAANGESLYSYCGQANFNDAFIVAAEHRYRNISDNPGHTFIAVNLFNSEHVLPNMATQLLALAEMLGRKRVFISVFENGSTDNTKPILRVFERTLAELGIPHKIVADNDQRPQMYHRIEYMAELRNRALEPLYAHNAYSRVVFLNDIFVCLPDLAELLYQSQFHRTHLTCAEDFDTRHNSLEFYDTWVSRDMLGQAFKSRHQNIAEDSAALIGQLHNRPFQVQCCWNGLAVLDAQVFSGSNALRFRRSGPSECSASECSLLCNDLWRAGYQRMLVVPRIKVAYNVETRDRLRQPLNFPRDTPFGDRAPRAITFRPGPKTVYCNPLNGVGTSVPDGPASQAELF